MGEITVLGGLITAPVGHIIYIGIIIGMVAVIAIEVTLAWLSKD